MKSRLNYVFAWESSVDGFSSPRSSINKDSETNDFIESDIRDKLTIVTKYLNTSQLVIGFMLNEEQKGLLN